MIINENDDLDKFKNITSDGKVIYNLGIKSHPDKLNIGGVQLREDIINGQRIEGYLCQIHDKTSDNWYNLTDTKMSLTVGNKRIQTYNVSRVNVYYDELQIIIYSYLSNDPNMVKLKSISMYDWTYISQNQLEYLDWNSVINAGK